MIKQFRTLTYFEWLNFRSERSMLLFAMLILLSGLYGIYSGSSLINNQKSKLEALDKLYQENIAEMKQKFPADADAGDIGYYHSTFAKNLPDNWAKLSIGQRDVAPSYLKLRLLAVQNQLYASENTNPFKLSVGSFDLAFVFVFLLPLFIISISFNVLSSEREQGTLALVLSFPVKLSTFLLAKLTFRFIVVAVIVFTLSITGWLWADVVIDARALTWLMAILLYALFWFSVSFAIIAIKRNSAFNAVSLLGIWLLLVVIFPVLAKTYSEVKIPVDEGLAISLKQRQEVHSGWDKPRAETMKRFFQRYPQFKDTTSVEGAFKWKWYFAFQELGDASVESLFENYMQKLTTRAALSANLDMLSPAAKLQQTINGISGTGFQAQLDFLLASKNYHERLKKFYYPFLFKNLPFTHDDFASEPQMSFRSKADDLQIFNGLIAMMGATVIAILAGLIIYKSSNNILE
ncbi:DUF3526 domain-containing protein [Pedobacter sp. Leaf250]|uniref:ABC transporter permease n=1 Tax=Pedobacter sp. Leaf250 TaxID=2876559 RepID=UPI001E4E3AA5|nr:DUF3526 domain-containing protein [Pedobacter sp. Leaf250]